jgi:hypothetical protein
MRYLILMAALCFPSVSSAANYLCLPEVTVGWTNNENPNDIRIIEPQNKWLLQPIEQREIPFAYMEDKEEVNYSLTKLGEPKEYGFCNIMEVFGYCYEFNWPDETPNPNSDNKLSYYDQFGFQKTENGSAVYVFSAVGNQQYYAIDGVNDYSNPKIAIERGACDAF